MKRQQRQCRDELKPRRVRKAPPGLVSFIKVLPWLNLHSPLGEGYFRRIFVYLHAFLNSRRKEHDMGTLAFNSNALDKYFGVLKHLDIESKKKLIQKLTASIRRDHRIELSMDDLFGAWKDSRNADEIIHYIEDSRVNNTEIEPLS